MARKKEIFGGKKGLSTGQTVMKKSKLQSYMPTNEHNVSKPHIHGQRLV